MSGSPTRVALVGCGEAGQAIHLPFLARARLADPPGAAVLCAVVDPDPELVATVARHTGARPYPDLAAMLRAERVDLVVLAGPDRTHADQLVATAEAGVPTVCCEKPLVTDRRELARVRELRRRTGVTIVTPTMHLHDPAVRALLARLEVERPAPVDLVESRILLPDNAELIEVAADVVGRRGPVVPRRWRPAEMLTALAVHDLPVVRRLAPDGPVEVVSARTVEPWGYDIHAWVGPCVLRLQALLGGHWDPQWTLTAAGPGYRADIRFPPSYVDAGSATAWLTLPDETLVWMDRESGYAAMWERLLRDPAGLGRDNEALLDMAFTLAFAEGLDEEGGDHG